MREIKIFKNKTENENENILFDENDDWQFEEEEEEKKDAEVDLERNDSIFDDHTLSSFEHKAHIWDLDTKLGRARFRIHLIFDHLITRIFSIFLVLVDVILVSVSLTENSTKFSIISILIASVFLVELLFRIFAWGNEFFHHRLEVLDMVIIIVSFICTLIVEIIVQGYAGDERFASIKLIIILRVMRIIMFIRICTGRKHMERCTRNLISQNKRRYVKDGFDLDLTFITENVVAMSFPSSGTTSLYRNPISEVARFFNTKYPDHYKIYNLCSERDYETHWFNDNVERVLIDDHNVPKLSHLLEFCHSADEWMRKDKENILVLHCKGGKGRTGTAVAAWLLYSEQIRSADEISKNNPKSGNNK